MNKIYLKSGDRRPVPSVTISEHTGAPVDLSAATVMFVMYPLDGTTATVNSTATIADPLAGTCYYDWGVGETDTPGTYVSEFQVTWNDGRQLTVPSRGFIEVEIAESLS